MMIAYEKSIGIDVFRVGQIAMNFMGDVLHHGIFGEVAGNDRAAFEAEFFQFGDECFARDPDIGAQDQRESEPAAFPDLRLKGE